MISVIAENVFLILVFWYHLLCIESSPQSHIGKILLLVKACFFFIFNTVDFYNVYLCHVGLDI